MYYSDEIIAQVQERSDIVDIVSQYVRLKKQGANYFGICPFHNEKSASFSVSPQKQMYYCFGCGAGGSVFTFIQQYENFTFPEAVQYLAERARVELPTEDKRDYGKEKKNRAQKLLEVNKEAAKYFFAMLRNKPGKIGKRYFEERQLSEETMKKFGLGYSLQYADDLVLYLRKAGFSDDLIYDSGLAIYSEKYGLEDKFSNRVMFPICDVKHRVIGFGGRVMGDFKPKYLNSPETPIFDKSRNLYGLNYARTSRKNQIILCEGYMDVIAMHQAGFDQAVASLGTAFTDGQALLLRRYTKDVYLAYDSDGAGVKAALRASGILRGAGLNGKVIDMQPYKDPDEFIKNLGAEEFQKRIDNAENLFLYEVRMKQKNYNQADPAQKTEFEVEIARMLCRFDDELEMYNYMEAVCRTYHINKEALLKETKNQSKIVQRQENRYEDEIGPKKITVKNHSADDAVKKSQRMLLTWLADEPGIYPKIEGLITPKDFTDELYQDIATKMFEGLKAGNFQAAAIINGYEDLEQQKMAAEVFYTPLEGNDTPEERSTAFHDVLMAVKQNSYRHFVMLSGKDPKAIQEVLEGKKALEKLSALKIDIG